MTGINMIGLDLAKEIFELHGVDAQGRCVLKKRLKRKELAAYFSNIPSTMICMEACGGSNYWARKFLSQGHQVRIISAQYVKPFLKSQKNDANDAQAIVEACSRPSMRFVAVKQPWQQDIQSLHRVRQRLVTAKVALMNQTRSLLGEYGITLVVGLAGFKKLPLIIEDAANELSAEIRSVLQDLFEEYQEIERRKKKYDQKLESLSESHAMCKKLKQIPGVGPLTSTAFVAAVGDARQFKNGRQVAAWLGLVPRQHSSGGRTRLLGITKRGDVYLRSLMVHGGRAVSANCKLKKVKSARSEWIEKLTREKGINKAAVAIANHNARVMWAIMMTGEDFRVA